MAMYGPACPECRSNECPGCADPEEDLGPAQGPYDATPAPPALLDPNSVLRNRRRTQLYLATGIHTWPRLEPQEEGN